MSGFLFIFHLIASIIFHLYKNNMISFENTSLVCYKIDRKIICVEGDIVLILSNVNGVIYLDWVYTEE